MNFMQIDNLENILVRRKEIEDEIVEMLKETDPTSPRLRRGKEQFTLQDVKDVIYNEEDNDDMIYPIGYDVIQRGEVVAMFDPSSRTQGVHYGAGRGACPPKPRRRRGNASELTPLDTANNLTGLSNVLELVTDAWNYFPHEVLGGISPAEKLLEHPQ